MVGVAQTQVFDVEFRAVTKRFGSLTAVDAAISTRTGAIAQAPAGPNNYFALEYYKQLVPNAEVTLPGSKCATCEPVDL